MSYKFLRNYILLNKYSLVKKQNNLYFITPGTSVLNTYWIKSYFLNKVFFFNFPGGLKYSFSNSKLISFVLRNNTLFDPSRFKYSDYQLTIYFFHFFFFFSYFKLFSYF